MNAFMRNLRQQIEQSDINLHLLNVAPHLTVELLQLCLLKRRNLPVRITNLTSLSPRNDDFGRMDSKLCASRNLPHLGTDQGEDARGVAAGHVAQGRWQHLSRLLQGAAGLLARLRTAE